MIRSRPPVAAPTVTRTQPLPERTAARALAPPSPDAFSTGAGAAATDPAPPATSFKALAARQGAAAGAILGTGPAAAGRAEELMGEALAMRRLHDAFAPLFAGRLHPVDTGQVVYLRATASQPGDRNVEVSTASTDVLFDEQKLARVVSDLAAGDTLRSAPYLSLTLQGTEFHHSFVTGNRADERGQFVVRLGRDKIEWLDETPERLTVKVSSRDEGPARRIDVLTLDRSGPEPVLTLKCGTSGLRRLFDRKLGDLLSMDLAELFPSSQSVKLEPGAASGAPTVTRQSFGV